MDAVYNEKGEQIPDNTPVELPLGYAPPEDLQTMIKRMVVDAQVVAMQDQEGIDTEEEANDFDIMGEDDSPPSGYEYTEMQEEQVTRERTKSVEQPKDEPAVAPEAVDKSKPKAKAKQKVKPVAEDTPEDQA